MDAHNTDQQISVPPGVGKKLRLESWMFAGSLREMTEDSLYAFYNPKCDRRATLPVGD